MSWDKLHGEIRRRRDLSLAEKVIFTWLVPLVSKGVHPGYRTIALECGVDKNTARKALVDLEAHGLLRVDVPGAGHRPRYLITWEPSPEPTEQLTRLRSTEPTEQLTRLGPTTDRAAHPVEPENRPSSSPGLSDSDDTEPTEQLTHHRPSSSPGSDRAAHPQPDHQTNSDQEPAAAARAPVSAPTREASPAAAAVSERAPRSGSSLVKLFEDACDRATGTRPDLTGRPTVRAAELVKAHPWDTLEHSVAAFERHLAALSPEDRAGIRSYFAVWASDVARWPERVAHNGTAPGRRSKHIKPSERYARPVAEIEAAARAPTADIVAELRAGRKRAEA